ncbi:hypothetical protein MYSTI_07937 [Myxococcus stipitatus DSM 14675]|uniref:Uncharacterized protein n=1 Tax=Myxococcus stipitatus (strain DSM 14675 / JCM 12634 / Mx s8) TaxID=1278073 RepID=L7URG9_MYXSD|nr:hypothetical protein MYSTI_07937 [Myxococcus stipitatus DSM 14675]
MIAGAIQCSTPSGITASGGGRARHSLGSPSVLNAFRHHGERRRGGSCASTIWRSVLNAFRHHGERRDLETVTKYQIPQMCSTPSGITASGGIDTSDLEFPESLCSTPSGITASGGRSRWKPRCAASRVLNAFRHHGERRLRPLPSHQCDAPSQCSTPSGITASGGWPVERIRFGPYSAQRLPASRRAAGVTIPLLPCRPEICAQRLPASRRAAGTHD